MLVLLRLWLEVRRAEIFMAGSIVSSRMPRAVLAGICLAGLSLFFPSLAGATHVLTISGSTTWTAAGSPYVVKSVTITSSGTLTIEPGVVVKINGTTQGFSVDGKLVAGSSSGNPVVFTSIQDDSVGGDSGGDGPTTGAPGQWMAINVNAGGTASLTNSSVRFGGYGTSGTAYSSVAVSGSGVATLTSSTVSQSQTAAIRAASGGTLNLDDATVEQSVNGVVVVDAKATIRSSVIRNNSDHGVHFSFQSSYVGGGSALFDTAITGSGSHGIYQNVPSALATEHWPHGNRNRIYGNAGLEVDSFYENRDVDWRGNYFGSDVSFRRNPSVCDSGEASGYLVDAAGNRVVANYSYAVGDTLCYADRFDIGEGEYATDATYAISTGQMIGTGSFGVNPTAIVGGTVNSRTGSFTTSHVDVKLPGIGLPMVLERRYAGQNLQIGLMGPGWSSVLDTRLEFDDSGDVDAYGPDGQRMTFWKLADGSYSGPDGARSTLSYDAGSSKYTLKTRPAGHELVFDAAGKPSTIRGRNGHGLTFGYTSGALSSVTDSAGRVLAITVNAGRVTSITLPDGRSISYGYTNGYLTSVTDMRAKVTSYSYDGYGRLDIGMDARSKTLFDVAYATDGRVSAVADANGNNKTYTWDQASQTATMTDQAGKQWKDVYDGGVRVKEIDPLGNTSTFTYDGDLNIASRTDPNGHAMTMAYDARGNMVKRTAPAPFSYVEEWTYDGFDNVLTHLDGRGNTTSSEYDAAGFLIRETSPGSVVTQYALDAAGTGLVDSITDPRGHVTTFTYDADYNKASQTTPEGGKTTWQYDGSGRVTSTVEPRGNVAGATSTDYDTLFTWDAEDNKLSETDPLGHVTSWTYDSVGNTLTETDANNNQTSFAYDNANNRTSVTAPDLTVASTEYDARGLVTARLTDLGRRTTYSYDDAGRKIAMVTPRGNQTGAVAADHSYDYQYDAAGNLTKAIDPLNRETTYTYDALNRRKTVSDGKGNVTTFGYDANSNRTSETDAAAGARSWTYDALNRMTSATNRRAKTTTYTYDAAGNRTRETLPSGASTTYSHDMDDRLVARVEPRGNETGATPTDYDTTYSYDAAGNLLTETDPLGNATTFTYDRNGRRASETDARNQATEFAYDALDRLTRVTDPASNATTYTYDSVGNLLTRTDANTNVTTMAYDDDRRMVSLAKPGSRLYTYTWDANANKTSRTDANGNDTTASGDGTTTYSYDAADQLTGVDYADATPDVTFSYDLAGNRTQMTDGQGSESYSYNALNLLTGVSRGTDSFSYTYNAEELLTQRSYPDSTATSYTYDADGRMATATTGTSATSYAYDAAGNLTQTTLPSGNGHSEQRAWDRAGRLTRITNASSVGTLSEQQYTLDAVGNPTQIDLPGTAVETYAYDALDRVTEACYQQTCTGSPDPYVRYTYDAVGNRLTSTTPAATTTSTYNAADELVQTATGSSTTSYAYDKNGNQTAAGSDTFSYDLENRTTQASTASGSESYTYDGDGKRATSTTGAATTTWLWDTNHEHAQLALERSATGTTTRAYTYGLRRIAMQTGGATHYYHYGLVDNVLNVTSSSGAELWKYEYDPFGTKRTQTRVDPTAPDNPMQFAGEYADPTGLTHLRARQYDPTMGRFTSTDPATPELEDPYVSSYVYSNNRPGVLIDPSGETPVAIAGRVAIGVAMNPALRAATVGAANACRAPVALRTCWDAAGRMMSIFWASMRPITVGAAEVGQIGARTGVGLAAGGTALAGAGIFLSDPGSHSGNKEDNEDGAWEEHEKQERARDRGGEVIDGRVYDPHALERAKRRGIEPGREVEDIIKNGETVDGTSSENHVICWGNQCVVLSPEGDVETVMLRGEPEGRPRS